MHGIDWPRVCTLVKAILDNYHCQACAGMQYCMCACTDAGTKEHGVVCASGTI